LSAKIVEDQFAVLAQGPGDLLHELDTRAHHLPASIIEEVSGAEAGGGESLP
jgi:hypothetical protein